MPVYSCHNDKVLPLQVTDNKFITKMHFLWSLIQGTAAMLFYTECRHTEWS